MELRLVRQWDLRLPFRLMLEDDALDASRSFYLDDLSAEMLL